MNSESGENKIKVLYLPRWYPNKYDPMPGLFIERHALAALKHCNISVLYVHADAPNNSKQNNVKNPKYEIISSENNGLYTIRIYYAKSNCKFKPLAALTNSYRFINSNIKGFRIIKRSVGKPDIVHIHVLTRLGIIALVNKIINGTPYLITEHWTRYLPSTDTYHGFFRKLLTRIVVKNASAVMPVTENLQNAMISCGLKNANYKVIPNVVDVDKFHLSSKKNKSNKKKIVHLSCFADKQKNISGILRVIKRLSEQRDDFECYMIGDGVDFEVLKHYSDNLGLTDKFVFFAGLKENDELVEAMNDADFMIMFSNYENLPVVILESYSCGVPVISTKVGGIHEHLNENLGLLVKPKDEDEFYEKINFFLDNLNKYNKDKIRKYSIDHFSNEVIGQSLYEVYKQILNK